MSALIKIKSVIPKKSTKKSLTTHNAFLNDAGQLLYAKKQVKSFLADYNNSDLPELPNSISTSVSSLENSANQLKLNQDAYARSKRIDELEDSLQIVVNRISQANGFINRLNSAQNTLAPLRNSSNSSIKNEAISLYNTAASYKSALNNAISILTSTRSGIERSIENA